jgi:hypothetical protein
MNLCRQKYHTAVNNKVVLETYLPCYSLTLAFRCEANDCAIHKSILHNLTEKILFHVYIQGKINQI